MNNLGSALRLQNRFDEALDCFDKALKINPERFEAIANSALIYAKKGNNNKALVLFDAALKIAPQKSEIYFNIALIYKNEENFEKALENIKKAINLSPVNSNYFIVRGHILEKLKQNEDAAKDYKKALELNPNHPDALNCYASVLCRENKLEEAETLYKKAIEYFPDNEQYLNNLSACLMQQNKLLDALETLREIIKINPQNFQAANNLAIIVKQSGDMEEALGLFMLALANSSSPDIIEQNLYVSILDFAKHKDKKKIAIKITENWHKQKPCVFSQMALCELKGKNPPLASKEYIAKFFNQMASNFENKLELLEYKMPEIILKYSDKLGLFSPKSLDILDAGCGTGLIGQILFKYAKNLIGVDLSEKMLKSAEDKRIYSSLHCQSIEDFSIKTAQKFDLIICADVLCYNGDITDILQSLKSMLKPNGKLFFTVEFGEKVKNYQFFEAGRYKHGIKYIEKTLEKLGFKENLLKTTPIRKENKIDVKGIIVIAE